jgi:DNA (cytosine-5)-methyltransferase 1
MVKSLIPVDPHRLKAMKGPGQVLHPNSASCSLDELPAYMESLPKDAPKAVDLFCGAGGLSLGLHRAGFEVVLACDIRPDSIATHRHHFGGCSEQCDLSDSEVLEGLCRQLNAGGEVALVAGGPPCQPFSRNIRWRKHDDDVIDQHNELNQGRRELWESFLAVVEGVRPRAFLMENVPDIAQTGDQEVFRGIVSRAESLGYRVHARIVHAWEYGVPQLRPRLFIAGTRLPDGSGARYSSPLEWPAPLYGQMEEGISLDEAISDLPELKGDWWEEWEKTCPYGGPTNDYQQLMRDWLPVREGEVHDHITRKVRGDDLETFQLMRNTGLKYHQLSDEQRRYAVTSRAEREGRATRRKEREGSFSNKYNILKAQEPCLTVTAHMSKDGYWYIHPQQNRTLSIREAARVQSFPDGFRFHGTPSNRFHQVGEAVAPLVGEALGRAMLRAINQQTDESGWADPDAIRDLLLHWYREEGVVALQPWARQKESGEEIPETLKAWRVFLGELLVGELEPGRQALFWKRVQQMWPDHEAFLQDSEPHRRRTFRSLHLEKSEDLLLQVAIQLREQLDWREWVRTDLKGLGRDRIRQCLAMVGITTDRSCSVGLGRMVSRITGSGRLEKLSSRQHRELNLGLMLGGDQDGKIYRAAVAVAERWCQPEALCDGGPSGSSDACPLCISRVCSQGRDGDVSVQVA